METHKKNHRKSGSIPLLSSIPLARLPSQSGTTSPNSNSSDIDFQVDIRVPPTTDEIRMSRSTSGNHVQLIGTHHHKDKNTNPRQGGPAPSPEPIELFSTDYVINDNEPENDPRQAEIKPTNSITPETSWKKWIWDKTKKAISAISAFVTAVPSAFNAGATDTHVDAVVMTPSWFKNLNLTDKLWTSTYFGASMVANIIVAYEYAPIALKKFKTIFSKCCNSATDALRNTTILLLAFDAGFAAFGIAFGGLAAEDVILAWSVAGITGGITFAVRFVGVNRFVDKVRGLFDPDMKFTLKIADDLLHIDKKYLGRVNSIVANRHKTHMGFTPQALKQIFEDLETHSTELQNQNARLFRTRTRTDLALEYTAMFADVVLPLTSGFFAYLTFTQKGIDGPNILFKEFGNIDLTDYFDKTEQAIIGSLSGIANFMLYYMAMLDFRKIMRNVYHEIADNPLHPEKMLLLLKTMAFFVINYYSSPSMQSVPEGILNSSKRIFSFIEPNTTLGSLYVYSNRGGAGVINHNSCMNLFYGKNGDLHALHRELESKTIGDMTSEFKAVLTPLRNNSLFSSSTDQEPLAPPNVLYQRLAYNKD